MSLQSESEGDCGSDVDVSGVITPVDGNLVTESESSDEVAEDDAAINAAVAEAGAGADDGDDFGGQAQVCGALASSSDDEGEGDVFFVGF